MPVLRQDDMSEFGGHVAWTAIGGYFIGLVGMRPDTARLLPIVWVSLATLHGLWDSAAAVPSFSLLGGVYLVSFIYFIACLLKALQLEAQRSGVNLTEPACASTIWRASEVATWVKADRNSKLSASTFALLTPEASKSTVSFVEVSPSIEMQLKLCSAAGVSRVCSSSLSAARSVNR